MADASVSRRSSYRGRFTTFCWSLGLVACGTAIHAAPPVADAAPQAPGLADVRSPLAPRKAAAVSTPSQRYGLDFSAMPSASVPEVRLGALDVAALVADDAATRDIAATKMLRVGVGRDLQLGVDDGSWYDLADGASLWVADVVSAGAVGTRLHLVDLRLPAGAEIAVYAPGELDALSHYRRTGQVAEPVVDRYRAGTAATSAWTGTAAGERVRVEVLLPAGTAVRALPFTVDGLQHLYRDPVAAVAQGDWDKAAGACHNDVSCFPAWAGPAKAVAGITFVYPGGTGFCTGQLLNSLKPDFTPYFLTANHCLSTPAEAASAEFYWRYQTASCGALPPSLLDSPRSLGATLVSTHPTSDYTLLLVEGTLPGDLFWVGWNALKVPTGLPVAAIHHPSGDFKRISFGVQSPAPADLGKNFIRSDWTDGPTEAGSSGSGLFKESTQQLIGQLLGGPSSCADESFDVYGAFSATYKKIRKPLAGGSDDKSEPNDSCAKSRLVKAGTLAGRIVKVNDSDWYKISVPAGKVLTVTATFAHGNGDVDLRAFASCGGGAIVSSEGVHDAEAFVIQNVGNKPAFLWVQAFLAADVRNAYDLSFKLQ